MAPLTVDPVALDGAGAAVVSAGVGLGSVISTLTAALSGGAGMAGDDPAGAALGRSYDRSAAKLIEAMASTRNGLCSIGDGVRMSAHNYSLAEAMSDVTGRAATLPVPPVTGPFTAGSLPSAVGAGTGAPAGWGWVAPYIGMIWPSGDSAKLRAAAAAWNAAGVSFALAEIEATAAPMGAIRAQQIPEGATIDAAFSDAYASTTSIAQQCQTVAAQLSAYADQVDAVHAAILDLLARICDPMTGIKEVWDVLTDKDEDEIERIAHDIATVIHNFTGEANALGAQIATTLSAAATTATTMGRYAAKEWDQFLHGTLVGQVVNQAGQHFKGMGEEAWGLAKGLCEVSQVRAVLDPIGWFKSEGEMGMGLAPLVGAGGKHAPSLWDSWKEFGKGLVHWDDWSKNPAEALGKTEVDVAGAFLPGGPGTKLIGKGHDLLDAAKGLKKPPTPPDPPAVPHNEPPPTTSPPPRVEPPAPGRPVPAPSEPAPGSRLPHSPTESKPPVADKPPTGEPPKPVAAPPVSAGKPPVSAPTEHVPPTHPNSAEPVPARAPAFPGGAAAEPTPGAALPSQQVPTAPAPHGAPPHGETPGTHPAEPPPPHDGGPHRPGDGNGPHDSSPVDDDSSPRDHGHDHSGGQEPPTTRDVFPDAKEYGDLTEDEYRAQFEDENGRLIYPDKDDPAKPYALPGTAHIMTDTEIRALDGKIMDRIGYPGGEWLAPAGTPYEGRSLPHDSLGKPYFTYKVHTDVGLPSGWQIEESLAAAWFGHPGGAPQLRIVAPPHPYIEPSTQELLDTGFLKEIERDFGEHDD
jgi:hypothetical protein